MTITKDIVVTMDYILRDSSGKTLDSSQDSGPLDYLHGSESIVPGLEKALEGKESGAKLRVKVAAAEAYGQRDEDLVISIPKKQFESTEGIEPGMQFQTMTENGPMVFNVIGIVGDEVKVDGNHPLAGMDLDFEVEVLKVREATAEEKEHGHLHGGCGCGCEDGGCGDGECGCDEEGCEGESCGCK